MNKKKSKNMWDIEMAYGTNITVSGIKADTREMAIKIAKEKVRELIILEGSNTEVNCMDFKEVTFSKEY